MGDKYVSRHFEIEYMPSTSFSSIVYARAIILSLDIGPDFIWFLLEKRAEDKDRDREGMRKRRRKK